MDVTNKKKFNFYYNIKTHRIKRNKKDLFVGINYLVLSCIDKLNKKLT